MMPPIESTFGLHIGHPDFTEKGPHQVFFILVQVAFCFSDSMAIMSMVYLAIDRSFLISPVEGSSTFPS